MRLGATALLATLAVLVAAPADSASSASPRLRVIVAFRPARATRTLAGRERSVRAERARVLGGLRPGDFTPTARWDAVAAMPGLATVAGLARLRAAPGVSRVDLDRGGGVGDVESSALIGADAAQAEGFTGRGVTVAILDSGVDLTHPDLADAIVGQHCFVPPDGCPDGTAEQDGPGSAQDGHGHGTNVAGIVTGDGGVAPRGVAPDSSLVVVRVTDRLGRYASSAQVVSGLNWIATTRPDVKVVNMSLGSDQLYSGRCDGADASTMAFASAVAALRSRGVTVFASAMNNGSKTQLGSPACVGDVVAVGAVYDSAFGYFDGSRFGYRCNTPVTLPDEIACFSNSGPALDLLAPGAKITSTGLGGVISVYSGTSQASPHVAAAAALLLQADPAATPDLLEHVLAETGTPVRDPRNGLVRPRIDVRAALATVQDLGGPGVSVSVSALDFGRVAKGRSRTLALRIANFGGAPLVVAAAAHAPFTVSRAGPATIPPGSAVVVQVVFRPGAVRRYAGALMVTSNDRGRPALPVRLTGTGTRAATR